MRGDTAWMSATPATPPQIIALFGPTGVGKTAVAVALAERLRARGEDPVAVSADALQVYAGLETLTGVASPQEHAALEHRLVSFLPLDATFSVGEYSRLAHAEIDGLLAAGRRPIVVGGTGLYLRAALADLDLRPAPVGGRARALDGASSQEHGPHALHAELAQRALVGSRGDRPEQRAPHDSCARGCSKPASSNRPTAPRSCGAPSCASRRCSPG